MMGAVKPTSFGGVLPCSKRTARRIIWHGLGVGENPLDSFKIKLQLS